MAPVRFCSGSGFGLQYRSDRGGIAVFHADQVIIDAVPGHVFKGEVVRLMPAMAEGEVQTGGTLLSASGIAQHGRAVALIELEEDLDHLSALLAYMRRQEESVRTLTDQIETDEQEYVSQIGDRCPLCDQEIK